MVLVNYNNPANAVLQIFDEADLVFILGVFSDESGFWIGKASLRSWRQLALDQLEEDEEETKHNNSKVNGEKSSSAGFKGTETCRFCLWLLLQSFICLFSFFFFLLADGVKGDNEEGDGEEMKNFNEDILCYHGLFSLWIKLKN